MIWGAPTVILHVLRQVTPKIQSDFETGLIAKQIKASIVLQMAPSEGLQRPEGAVVATSTSGAVGRAGRRHVGPLVSTRPPHSRVVPAGLRSLAATAPCP
jgi:hypothetical protein